MDYQFVAHTQILNKHLKIALNSNRTMVCIFQFSVLSKFNKKKKKCRFSIFPIGCGTFSQIVHFY